jgi:multidrug efflux pump subunit AcrA (membrane-fusion protein)
VKAWLLVLAACGGGGAVEPMATEAVRTQAVHRRDIVERVVLTGEVHAEASENMVVPRTENGPLAIRWMAEDGEAVKAGDKVLELDNSAVTKALEDKRLAVVDAEMTLKAAEDIAAMETQSKITELAQHKIAFDKATVKASVPGDLLSGREAQDRALDKRRMEVAFNKAQEALAAQKQEAALDLQVKRIDLDKAKRAIDAAEKTIAELVLAAPRAGVVVVETHPWEGRKFHTGDTVQAGMTIITMPDLSRPMEVRAELSDVDDGLITTGMPGSCTLDAYPTQPVTCAVKELAPVARTKGQDSLRRAFAVVVSLSTSDPARMRPGMSVKVELKRPPVANALVVPRAAIVDKSGEPPTRSTAASGAETIGKTVRVRMSSGEARDVTLGACDAQGCAVEHGLADGDVVIVGGGA